MLGHGETVGELINGDGQVQWGGMVLGDGVATFMDDEDGLVGWEDLPSIRSGNVARPAQHGSWPGRQFASDRVVTWSGSLAPRSDMQSHVIAMRAATSITSDGQEQPLVVRTLGETLVAWGQVTNRSLPVNRRYARGDARLVVQWTCTDPRRYSLTEENEAAELPVGDSTGGLVYPLVYPLDYGPEISSSSLTAVNQLDTDTPPRLMWTGPLERPGAVNTRLGRLIEFDLILADTDTLIVDCRDGTVLLNAVADRLYTRTSASVPLELFVLAKGENEIALRAQSWGAGNRLDCWWRHATL